MSSPLHLDYESYLKGLDLENWYRYYFVIKEVVELRPRNILEIGAGSEIVKNCLKKWIEDYEVMDINPNLSPNILLDLREMRPDLIGRFDCLICCDVLEHTPFDDLEKSLRNIFAYLTPKGRAILTIPHRGIQFVLLNSFFPRKPFIVSLPPGLCFTPRAFYSRFVKKETWRDPAHCWEIGDGTIRRKDVESIILSVGFGIEKSKRLFYVRFWVLKKA